KGSSDQLSEEKELTSINEEKREVEVINSQQTEVDLVNEDPEKAQEFSSQIQETSTITTHASFQQSTQLTGVAISKKTSVYEDTDSVKVLKSYEQGHILKYRAFSDEWFQATVYIDGEPKKGYINAKDVETEIFSPKTLQGIGIKSPTKVYAKASTT